VALIALIVAAPLLSESPQGSRIETGLLTVVLVAAVLAVGHHKRTLVAGLVLATPAVVVRWVHHFQAQHTTHLLSLGCFVAFLGFVVFEFLLFVLRSRRVDSEVLSAAVSIYLLLALLWASVYAFVAVVSPGAISGLGGADRPVNGFDALYFSVLTMTTVGYGDMVPVSSAARMLVMLQAVTGTMYLAVLVARLVAVYTAEEHARPWR
jgi:hypothetical protein